MFNMNNTKNSALKAKSQDYKDVFDKNPQAVGNSDTTSDSMAMMDFIGDFLNLRDQYHNNGSGFNRGKAIAKLIARFFGGGD